MRPAYALTFASSLAHGLGTSWDAHQKRRAELARRRAEDERIQAESDLVEYRLIQAKQSKLSANERRAVVRRVEARATTPEGGQQ